MLKLWKIGVELKLAASICVSEHQTFERDRIENIINGLPLFSEQSGFSIGPFLNEKWIIRLFPGLWFNILENRKFWDVTSPGPLIPDEDWAWWQLRRVTGIKPSNSQTASNLLTWLMAPNQYFTISLENLNTKNIHRSENWQNWGDFAAGSSFPVSVAGSQDGATAGTKWGFERKRDPRNIRGRVSASWWISPGQKISLVKNIIYTSSQFINSTSLVAWFS